MSKKKRSRGKKNSNTKAVEPSTPVSPAQVSQGRPTISVCMMVKNEEKNLPRALNSVKDWVDEIIVVDTGSTDGTIEIAESYGAKIYHHPWENDFSKHRNQSISYATCDWLLILDADEEVDQETAPHLRQITNAPQEVHCYLFELLNDVAAGGKTFVLHPRLFRNGVGFHYQGIVHNRPMVYGQVVRTSVRLIHYGYNETPEVMEAKHQRRTTMIRSWIEKEPDNFLAHSYLAHALISKPESLNEAVEEALEALRLLRTTPGEEQRYPHIYYPILNALTNLARDDELMSHAEECLKLAPYYPDPLYFMAWVAYKRQAWQDVCDYASRYMTLQEHCRQNPQDYIFFENMTFDQMNTVLMRWVVAAAKLGQKEEAKRVMGLVIGERGGEDSSKSAVLTLLNTGHAEFSLELAELVYQEKPEWSWPNNVIRLGSMKQQEKQTTVLVEQAEEAIRQGRGPEVVDSLRRAANIGGAHSAKAHLNLAQALDQAGRHDEAEAALIKGLNAHPGHAWAWRRLADICMQREDYTGAAACFRRFFQQQPGDDAAKNEYEKCLAKPAPPTVAQKPPKLVVFLVGGLTPELVRMPAPHFLIGTAWGEFLAGPGPQPDAPNWASLYTGAPPVVHGLQDEPGFERPLSLQHLNAPAFWEVLPPEITIGLAAAPMTTPPPKVNGWALAGFPGGLLNPDLVHPAELTPRVLATGFRTDYSLNEFDLQTAPQRLEGDIRQEGLLYQYERNKLIAAANMPTVDLLVIGLNALEYMQKARELATYQMFGAYQQLYGWLETFLTGVQPESFALFSQRGYARQGFLAERGGFYCMSWLRGENGKANITDAAGEIVKYFGGDPGRLGRSKG